MINLSNVASMARAVLNDSNKPKSDLMINVVSHIAGKVALQVGQSLLEQKSRLNERQQKGLSVILDALRGKEPVSHVETHASGGRFKLARAAFDVASVVWERDTKRPEVMSFISFLDSTGKSLFSLGKQLAKALTTAGPGLHQDSTVAANLRNTILTSKLHMSKVMRDIENQLDKVLEELAQSGTNGASPPPSRPVRRPAGSERPAGEEGLPRRPRTESAAPPPKPRPTREPDNSERPSREQGIPRRPRTESTAPPPKAEPNDGKRQSTGRPDARTPKRLQTHQPRWGMTGRPSHP